MANAPDDDAVTDAFLEALGRPSELPRGELTPLLAERLRQAEGAWPFRIDRAAFARRLAHGAPADRPLRTTLESLHAPDLYLATACGLGDSAALVAFTRLHTPSVRQVHARSSASAPPLDDLVQAVNERLFVGPRPKILAYRGSGSLDAWVRVVAARALVDLVREREPGRERPLDPARWPEREGSPLAIPAPDDDPELQLLKTKYRAEVNGAFEEAFLRLGPEERNTLREYYVHALSVDQIAELRHIHRSTAARRVAAARQSVLQTTREILMQRTGLGWDELESLVRLVQSQMHVSIERVLGA